MNLTPIESSLYQELVANKGDTVSTNVLAAARFKARRTNEDNRIASHIKNLRRKLPEGLEIETIRGFGYRLISINN